MKESLIGLVVLVVVLGAGFYVYNQKMAGVVPADGNSVVATSTVATSASQSLADGEYKLDPIKSVANWEGRKVVLTNWIDQGTIKIASGTAEVSSSTLTATALAFDMNSIVVTSNGKNGGFDMLAKHLKSDSFFNAEKYPTAKFVAKNLVINVKNLSEQKVTGDLTIRDVTKTITLPVTISGADGELVVSGSTTVDRSVFNVKYGSGKFFKNLGDGLIDDNFTLSFKVAFVKN